MEDFTFISKSDWWKLAEIIFILFSQCCVVILCFALFISYFSVSIDLYSFLFGGGRELRSTDLKMTFQEICCYTCIYIWREKFVHIFTSIKYGKPWKLVHIF